MQSLGEVLNRLLIYFTYLLLIYYTIGSEVLFELTIYCGNVQLKRPQAKARFAREIAEMYGEIAGMEKSQLPLRSSL